MATNASAYPTANEMNHRFVRSNGIKMHIAQDGEGTLVVLATAIRNCGTLGGIN